MVRSILTALVIAGATLQGAHAAEVRMLAAGATKAIVEELAAQFKAKTGHVVTIASDTAGGIARRVEAGEAIDIATATAVVIDGLMAKGKLATGSRADLANSLIGIAVKEGAPKPDVSTVTALKDTLTRAATVAYVDPASGGTSGIYLAGVFDRLGLTDMLKPKLRLQAGGYVAERVARGEAEIVLHQMSEILPVKGVTIIGTLPAEIALVTTYSAGLAPNAPEAARQFLAFMAGPEADAVIVRAGMARPGR
jgi:molybdate transport system substrate-binding protein